jgi:hypothetical protein
MYIKVPSQTMLGLSIRLTYWGSEEIQITRCDFFFLSLHVLKYFPWYFLFLIHFLISSQL